MTSPASTTIYAISTTDTPLGVLHLALADQGVVALSFGGQAAAFRTSLSARLGRPVHEDAEALRHAADRLEAYLAGRRREVGLPVDWSVLEHFQATVLREVAAIPAGGTRTYGQIARALGREGGARAVGRANATNPMPLVIPCHRVLAADGQLGGYSGEGGVNTKAWLLRLEGAVLL